MRILLLFHVERQDSNLFWTDMSTFFAFFHFYVYNTQDQKSYFQSKK